VPGVSAPTWISSNLYGGGDNFSLQNSHVLPALIRKFHDARLAGSPEVVVWGSGTPRREFLYVEDLADATLFLMKHYDDEQLINIGVGEDLTILELARLVARVVGFEGNIVLDPSKPDGAPRKLLDVSRLTGLGWRARTSLEEGVRATYLWFKENAAHLRL
jgi:GDP-L-fucose synthase